MNDASDAISDLQSKWDTLDDLDRARAVRAIHEDWHQPSRSSRRPSSAAHLFSAISSKRFRLRQKTNPSPAKAS